MSKKNEKTELFNVDFLLTDCYRLKEIKKELRIMHTRFASVLFEIDPKTREMSIISSTKLKIPQYSF